VKRLRARLEVVMAAMLAAVVALAGGARSQVSPEWTEPVPPFALADGLYYVGSKGLASYLVTTPEGHVLINSNVADCLPLLRESVAKLGFQFSDIKILLISHAHWDHCAGSAAIKDATGAQYMVMEGDAEVVESGGKADFQYGGSPEAQYPPTKVDRVLHDRDEVRLGDTVLVAHLTPGHTKGCTTWTLKARSLADPTKLLDAVIVGSPNVNDGYRLVNNQAYWEIAADYDDALVTLASLPCDLFLGAHGSYFDLEAKFARRGEGGASAAGMGNPFVDPEGYKEFVAAKKKAFEEELAQQVEALPVKAGAPRVEIADTRSWSGGTIVQLRAALRPEDAAFLDELYDFAVARFGEASWNNFGPDSSVREIAFVSKGRLARLRSWHPVAEKNASIVAASYGLTALEDQDRESFLKDDDPAYVAKRQAFDEIANRLREHYGRPPEAR
jgi:metallo-beta-lactamase class B